MLHISAPYCLRTRRQGAKKPLPSFIASVSSLVPLRLRIEHLTTMGVEEQIEEREVLASIFPEEITGEPSS